MTPPATRLRRRACAPPIAVAIVVAVAVALGGLAGCGGTARRPGSTAAPPPSPSASVRYDPNAALTVGIGSDPGQWNCDAAGVDRTDCLAVADRVWPSAFRLAANGTVQLDPTLVASATQTDDSPQTIVYRINPKAAWSDGTPVTYQDFVYNWQAQSGSAAFHDIGGVPFTPASTAGYDDVASVTGAPGDPRTVTVTFNRPDPDWRMLFGAGHPLVPAQVAQRVGYDHGFTDPVSEVLSAGPFEVQSYQPGSAITLVRNPRYWGPPANAAAVTFRNVADPAQLAPALRAGELDGVLLAAGANPPAAVASIPGVNVEQRPSYLYERLDLNGANQLLSDPVLRHAIMLGVPRDAIVKRVEGPVDPSITLLDNRFFPPGTSGYQDNTGGAYSSANPSQAKQLLAQAGYGLAAGILTKAGRPVTLRITSTAGDAPRQAEEQLVVGALAHLGITVTEVDGPDVEQAVAQGNYDLAIDSGMLSSFPSVVDGTYLTGGPANVTRESDPHVDGLIAEAATTFDPQHRADVYNQIDTQLWADETDLPLFQVPASVVIGSAYLNVDASATAEGPTFDLDQWGTKATS